MIEISQVLQKLGYHKMAEHARRTDDPEMLKMYERFIYVVIEKRRREL